MNIAIRSNLISRVKALKIAKKLDGKVNNKNIESFCKYLNISKSEYDVIVDSFVNHDLFIKDNVNGWRLRKTRV